MDRRRDGAQWVDRHSRPIAPGTQRPPCFRRGLLRVRCGGCPGSPSPGDAPIAVARQSADMTKTGRRRMGSLRRVMPGLDVPATYQKEWFGKDIISGVVLATL